MEIGVTMIGTSWVNTVFVRDDLPELGTDLVTALAGLKVDNFSHVVLDLKNCHFSPKTQKIFKNLFFDLLVFVPKAK